MIKKALYYLFLLLCCIYLPLAQAEEKITLSTYYPAPYGEYDYLAANSMVVGRTYPFPAEDNLIVEGSVGIGTTDPRVALHIEDSVGGVNLALESYTHLGTRYSNWDTWLGQNIRTIDDVNTSGIELATSYIASGASALNIGFNSLNFYQWSAASLSGLSTGSDLTLPVPSFTINSSGSVGIGTTSPSSRLHIRETGMETATPLVFMDANYLSGGGGDGYAGDGSVLDVYTSRGDGFSDGYIARFRNSASTKLYIRGDGNVGIGTTSPGYPLHIYGANPRIAIQDSTGDRWQLAANSDSSFGIYSTNTPAYRFYINSSGYVGIGTTTPGANLDVKGDVLIQMMRYTGSLASSTLDTAIVSMYCGSQRLAIGAGYTQVVKQTAAQYGTTCAATCSADASYTSCAVSLFWNPRGNDARVYVHNCAYAGYQKYCCCY